MKRATTPTLTLTLPDTVNASDLDKLVVTIQQGARVVEKRKSDCTLSGHTIAVELTHADTCKFTAGDVEIALHALTNDGKEIQSDIETVPVERVLNDEDLTE